MKNLLAFFFISLILFSCGGSKEEKPNKPLSSQNFEIEIYDSLVVDYIGTLELQDVNSNQSAFLLRDQNTDTILVINSKGEIVERFKLSGEGPNQFKDRLYGLYQFLTNEEFLIPTTGGVYQYDLQGKLIKHYKPDFTGMAQIIISGKDNLFIKDEKVYLNLPGRGADEYGQQGIDYQIKSTHVEVLDLQKEEYTPAIIFPNTSKFSSDEKAYKFYSFYPALTLSEDSLFISYRHEPKIFGYPLSDLNQVGSTKILPFDTFVQNEPKDDKVNNTIEFSELFAGTINSIHTMENNHFLVNYLAGITKEEYTVANAQAEEKGEEPWEEIGKMNKEGLVIFNGSVLSKPIYKPEILGNLNKFVSKDEIWFSLNFSEAENDYSVIYKTRIIEK
ncbi:DUF4221 family protein [Algoriphagus aestuarii]|nr:DUF4221 family protein [Algoriphagus aestuarii]